MSLPLHLLLLLLLDNRQRDVKTYERWKNRSFGFLSGIPERKIRSSFSLSLSLFTLFVFLSFLVLFLSCFRDGGRVKCGIRRGIIKFFKSWVDYYPLYLLERTNDVSCSRSTNLLPYLRKPLIRSVIGSKIGILVRLESIFQKYRDQDSIVNAFFFFFSPSPFFARENIRY